MSFQRTVPVMFFKVQTAFCYSHTSQLKGFWKILLRNSFRHKSSLQNTISSKILPHQLKETSLHQSLCDIDSSDLSMVAERFKLKGLNVDSLHHHGVRITANLSSLLFPFESLEREFSAEQSMNFEKETMNIQTLFTSFKHSSIYLFNWSSASEDKKEIVIVSNPLDAVAVDQETDMPVVSLSTDILHLSPELIRPFKSFQKIILWLKSEQLGPEIIKSIAQLMGKSIFLIRPQDYSSALSCLQSGMKLKDVLRSAESIYHEGVDMLSPYRLILLDRFKNSEKHSGLKWKRFTALNEILKGHRKGELTVFSGQTGTGKTTFVSEYSLDLCMQGLPTLWASFEIANERLLETMFCQYAQCSFIENTCEFHDWFDKFEKLPMYILNIQGRQSLKEMFRVPRTFRVVWPKMQNWKKTLRIAQIHSKTAMRLYVRVYNVQHVVVDNLQFLMNIERFNSAIDQYRKQDEIFGAFRGFATQCNCHVTLVIHPRKEPEFTELNNASISGTSKATQEADNILILQNVKSRQYIHITKNRYAGTKGCVMVEFDKSNFTFHQSSISSDGPLKRL